MARSRAQRRREARRAANIRKAGESFARREGLPSTPVRRAPSVYRSFEYGTNVRGKKIPYRFTKARRYVPRETKGGGLSPLELISRAYNIGQVVSRPGRSLSVCARKAVRKSVLFARNVAGYRRSPGKPGGYQRSASVCLGK